jgi:hypothetical protein
MPFNAPPRDPSDIDYIGIDWSAWLTNRDNDTIVTSTWPEVDGLTIVSQSNTTTTTTVVLSGGTADNRYTVTNRIVTANGLQKDRSIVIHVRNL